MTWHPAPPGRPVEPDPTLVRPEPPARAAARIAEDGRSVDIVYARGVWQRLHAVEVRQAPERVEVAVLLGITRELAAEMEKGPTAFTMQAIVEHTVVSLDPPLGGRELVVVPGPRPGPNDPGR